MCERLEIRLDQALTTLRQLASLFHTSLVDHAGLTMDQKAELKKMEYAQVVLDRDALRAHCIALQSRLIRPRSIHQTIPSRSAV